MDPEITGLAGTAGSTLVTLMATEAWQRARDGVVALWRRAHPDRADAIGDELDATRAEVRSAREDEGEDGQTEAELRAEWQGRLRRLLASRPDVADELRRLLAELDDGGTDTAPGGAQVRMEAHASGQSRIYQSGGDQYIREA